ncbi:MAG: alpha-L-fucosidase [Anaerolineae bacterium]|nr:alpha-L-fucosidase [Anaerolineae bacterium]
MSDSTDAIRAARTQRVGANQEPRLKWWRDARFGMFIHWGLYSGPAGQWKGERVSGLGEWIMYQARIPAKEYEMLADHFNPGEFDAAEWVSLAKRAGQRYLVITAKHHDGFCLFKTSVTDYNVVDSTPFGRDPMIELAEECEKQGLKFGFYYSQTQDWHHPGGHGNDWDYDASRKDFASYIEDYVKTQVRELLTNYGPIGVIWFDTPMIIGRTQSRSLLDLVHEHQPDCLVCGRVGNALGDYASAGDNRIPDSVVQVDWESPATINDTWGYRSDDENWKSAGQMIRKLVDIASKGGNYLLNVGPTAQGIVPQASVERLEAVGAWLRVNGESIYGTQAGAVQGLDWCRSTARSGRAYLHVFDWPSGGEIRIPHPFAGVARAFLLNDPAGSDLRVSRVAGEVVVSGPPAAPDLDDSVVVLELPSASEDVH